MDGLQTVRLPAETGPRGRTTDRWMTNSDRYPNFEADHTGNTESSPSVQPQLVRYLRSPWYVELTCWKIAIAF
jgi:hypothetical protein